MSDDWNLTPEDDEIFREIDRRNASSRYGLDSRYGPNRWREWEITVSADIDGTGDVEITFSTLDEYTTWMDRVDTLDYWGFLGEVHKAALVRPVQAA